MIKNQTKTLYNTISNISKSSLNQIQPRLLLPTPLTRLNRRIPKPSLPPHNGKQQGRHTNGNTNGYKHKARRHPAQLACNGDYLYVLVDQLGFCLGVGCFYCQVDYGVVQAVLEGDQARVVGLGWDWVAGGYWRDWDEGAVGLDWSIPKHIDIRTDHQLEHIRSHSRPVTLIPDTPLTPLATFQLLKPNLRLRIRNKLIVNFPIAALLDDICADQLFLVGLEVGCGYLQEAWGQPVARYADVQSAAFLDADA